VASGVTVSYVDPAAPWAAQVGATTGVTRLHAFLATRVALRYDDTAAGIDEQQELEALYGPLDAWFRGGGAGQRSSAASR
jgi:hypothetical protein